MSYNNRTLFDVYTKKYGGRLEIERFPKNYVLGYPYQKSREKINRFLKSIEVLPEFSWLTDNLLFDYVFNKKNFGISIIENGYYLFGVTFGFVDTIQYAVNTLFRCPGFFPEVGDSSKEKLCIEDLNTNVFKINTLKSVEEEEISFHFRGFAPPKDKDRVIAARIVSEYATSLILIHELAHIICGHLDFKKKGMKKIEFMEKGILFKEDYIFEFDADFMCFQLMLLGNIIYDEYLPSEYLNIKRVSERKLLYKNFIIELELQKYFSIATSIVFLITSQNSGNYYNWDRSQHPHPLCRIFALNILIENMASSTSVPQMNNDFFERWLTDCYRTIGFWGNANLPGHEIIKALDAKETVKLDDSVRNILNWINVDKQSPKHELDKLEKRKLAQSIFDSLLKV